MFDEFEYPFVGEVAQDPADQQKVGCQALVVGNLCGVRAANLDVRQSRSRVGVSARFGDVRVEFDEEAIDLDHSR
ncbi:MAG TPA: hypothetical protein VIY28_05055 [Pseudonocardiaceae bacterium]